MRASAAFLIASVLVAITLADASREASREAAAAREREAREQEAWEREKLDSLQAMAAWATASEEKTEESLGREESKKEPVPEGY